MAYDELLADQIRQRLSTLDKVEEKKMFRGVTFMVDGKMCICVSNNEMMCRIDPAIHQEVIKKAGCRTVIMKGRDFTGYVLITAEGMKTGEDFDYWITISLEFNKKAKASKKRSKSRTAAE